MLHPTFFSVRINTWFQNLPHPFKKALRIHTNINLPRDIWNKCIIYPHCICELNPSNPMRRCLMYSRFSGVDRKISNRKDVSIASGEVYVMVLEFHTKMHFIKRQKFMHLGNVYVN